MQPTSLAVTAAAGAASPLAPAAPALTLAADTRSVSRVDALDMGEAMRRISGGALRSTTQCRYGFRCLEEGDWPPCQPIRVTDEGIVIVEPVYANCPYFRETPEVSLCECPSRAEVFMLHRV